MRILHSEPNFLTALITAQMSLLQSSFFPEIMLEKSGWQLDASLLKVIYSNKVSQGYKQQRDTDVSLIRFH